MGRVLTCLVVLLAAACAGVDGPPEAPRLRIACVGDSITEGTANADHARNGWPRILGRLLEATHPARYEVGNFGRSGATLRREGRKPYEQQDVYAASHAFEPDAVVINLGTNDTAALTSDELLASFEADARWLIEGYLAHEPPPAVWLSTLTPMIAPHPRAESDRPARAAIGAILAALAAEYGLPLIDLTTPLEGHRLWLPDGVHPNTAGNEAMARAVHAALTDTGAGAAGTVTDAEARDRHDALPTAPGAHADTPRDASLRPRAVDGEPHALVTAGQPVDVELGAWAEADGALSGHGTNANLFAGVSLQPGDFHVRARLRMADQLESAAAFVLGDHTFGFEGARGTVFRNGPRAGGLRLLHPSPWLWERGAWIDFECIRNDGMVWFVVDGQIVDMAELPGPVARFGFDPMRSTMEVSDWSVVGDVEAYRPPHMVARTVHTPWVDISTWTQRHEVVPEPDVDHLEPVFQLVGSEQWAILDAQGSENATVRLHLGETRWTDPSPAAAILTGIGHEIRPLDDGRLAIVFRDSHPASPTRGDVVLWLGTPADIVEGREGLSTARVFEDVSGVTDTFRRLVSVDRSGNVRVAAHVQRPGRGAPEFVETHFTLAELEALLPTPGYDIPIVDLDADVGRHVVVDREAGQYLGHPTTTLLEDGRTILTVYPKGHGKGGIVSKRSDDGGLTWSERLPTPESWATSREVPTIHRVIDPRDGTKRHIMWSGLYPARLSVSEDDGASWSELEPVGDWGGIVVMGFVERLKDGRYLAMFHDDGRFISDTPARTNPPTFTLYQTFSDDGGLTWGEPEAIWSGSDIHLCEPGAIRSPDGDTLAVLLRENSRTRNSHVIFSRDEGGTWSAPRELPAALTGDRHTGKYAPDGRLFISFRDTTRQSPTQGDWVGWVGTFDDILRGTPGQYRVRIKDNKHAWDTTYPGVEVLPDGTFVVTTYGHWEEGEQPWILSARFTLDELDARVTDD